MSGPLQRRGAAVAPQGACRARRASRQDAARVEEPLGGAPLPPPAAAHLPPLCRSLPQPTPTTMDFKGQKLSETVCVWIVTVAAVLAFLYGYARQDFQVGKARSSGERDGCSSCLQGSHACPCWLPPSSCRALTAATFHTPACVRLSSSALPPSDDACCSHPAGPHLPLPSLASSRSPISRRP